MVTVPEASKHALSRWRNQLTGERGLLLAIIALAYDDLNYGDAAHRCDAQRYFSSDLYKRHLLLLDMPAYVKPMGAGK